MLEDCLIGLALMHIHQEIEPSIDEVINRFSLANRMLELKLLKHLLPITFFHARGIIQIWVLLQIVITSQKF